MTCAVGIHIYFIAIVCSFQAFVELEELTKNGEQMEWKETARWIKFEENVDQDSNRWGKPHVASLTFHSLLELKKGLEKGMNYENEIMENVNTKRAKRQRNNSIIG